MVTKTEFVRRIMELEDVLRALEAANEAVCAGRSEKVYMAMLDAGQGDALLALDNARRMAREALGETAKP